ncbi:hypothetical protein RE6C_02691 [Rhodopirellula europaea 6C]|uniref:Uncharacterized protein n=1 Tax=Rhodopirellula europaea 6C TaxID=1263867 RepID=M2A6E9_9BACT|nr:hypothetical protein RE6C_02691 [Rhodopirellula europaea 6C]
MDTSKRTSLLDSFRIETVIRLFVGAFAWFPLVLPTTDTAPAYQQRY